MGGSEKPDTLLTIVLGEIWLKFAFHTVCLDEYDVKQYLKELPRETLTELGEALGLHYGRLQRLQSCEYMLFLSRLVSAWLRQEDGVYERSSEPSWKRLAKALGEVGQNGIKARVLKDHCTC